MGYTVHVCVVCVLQGLAGREEKGAFTRDRKSGSHNSRKLFIKVILNKLCYAYNGRIFCFKESNDHSIGQCLISV